MKEDTSSMGISGTQTIWSCNRIFDFESCSPLIPVSKEWEELTPPSSNFIGKTISIIITGIITTINLHSSKEIKSQIQFEKGSHLRTFVLGEIG